MDKLRFILLNISFTKDDIEQKQDDCGKSITSSLEMTLQSDYLTSGQLVYAYVSPLIILVGIVSNTLSLIVIKSISKSRKNSKTNSCSYCLAALSISDLLVISFHLTIEWGNRGMKILFPKAVSNPILIHTPGWCHVYFFVSYWFRLTSVWFLVLFNTERYIAICIPLKKRQLCNSNRILKALLGITALCAVLSLAKPITNIILDKSCEKISFNESKLNLDSRNLGLYLMDTCYGLLLTLIPFIIILIFNILIGHKLLINRKDIYKLCKSNSPISVNISYQYALILTSISVCFLVLNFPYLITWIIQWMESFHILHSRCINEADYLQNQISIINITRTIFHLNYSINFFLYNLTGKFFRTTLIQLFQCSNNQKFSSKKLNRNSTMLKSERLIENYKTNETDQS